MPGVLWWQRRGGARQTPPRWAAAADLALLAGSARRQGYPPVRAGLDMLGVCAGGRLPRGPVSWAGAGLLGCSRLLALQDQPVLPAVVVVLCVASLHQSPLGAIGQPTCSEGDSAIVHTGRGAQLNIYGGRWCSDERRDV